VLLGRHLSFYERQVMPRLVAAACGTRPITRKRALLVPRARGDVLELGLGAGPNLPFYDAAEVRRVCSVEPSATLRARAERVAAAVPVEIQDGEAERLPWADATFDTVVCTFTLCTVQDPVTALREAHRVLRPGGVFLYCEHGLSGEARVARWQRRIEPVWKALAGGCHLTRDAERLLGSAGFDVRQLGSGFLRGTPRFVGWHVWGEATRA
jgi:SAM-dependent methyltransferase